MGSSFLVDRAQAPPRNSPWPEAAHYSKAPLGWSVVDHVLVALWVVFTLAVAVSLTLGGQP